MNKCLSLIWAVLVVSSLVLPPVAFSESQSRIVFGPEELVRNTGSTTVYTRTFTVPSYVVGPFLLQIDNGNPAGTNRVAIEDAVTSGRVILNGVEVVSPNEFTKTVPSIDKTVELNPTNTLEIQLNSAPDSYITLTISGAIDVEDLGQARRGHTATLLSDGTVLITGGEGQTGILSSAERFDPSTLTFSPHPNSLTVPRSEHTATSLPNTQALLVAGQDAQGTSFTVELFDPSTGLFSPLSNHLNSLRSGHTATQLLDGQVLIVGGADGTQAAQGGVEAFDPKAVDLFDPVTGVFTSLADALNTPRVDHSAVLLPDGKVLILGGSNAAGTLASAELYDPVTGQFTLLAKTMTSPRSGHTATLLPSGKVLILGGRDGTGLLASAELFDPASLTFILSDRSLLRARSNHTATLLPNGEILIAGGEESTGPTGHTELYGPPVADTTAPTVVSLRPDNGATQIYLNSIVAILFSEPIDAATLTALSLTLTGPGDAAVAGTVGLSESGLLAFFVPNAALSAGSLYTIQVDGITDLAGNALPLLTGAFTTYPAPTITGFTPAQGPAGTVVTISGEHFDADVPQNNTVAFFDGNEAAVSEATATTLTVTVPSGAINGPIMVSTPGGTATSAEEFIVALPPSILSFSPTFGFFGTTVTITGTDFDEIPANNVVRFNGVTAALESATTTVLTVKVPAGAASGPFSVTTPGGTGTAAEHFIVNPKPEISSVTPGSGTVGTAVTVTGLHFNSITPSDNQISFNGTGSIITSVTATTITTIVPLGATTGPVTVTNSGGTAATAPFTVLSKQDFSIAASPAQTSVVQGKTTTYQIQVNSTAGDFLTHFVQFSAADLPTGVTAAFSPPQVSGGQFSTLTVTTTASAASGNIGITVSGTASLEGRTVVRQATLQLLVVASGNTTLSGRVLASKDDRPIAGAKLKLGGQVATTDESGNFLFSNPPIGDQVILLDGPTSAYPADLPVPVTIATGVANDLLYPIYLHEVSQEYVTIVPGQEAIVNPPNIPDFSMHIPQGTTIVGWDGQANTQVSVTPVPIDRLPIRPIPEGVQTNTVFMFNFNKPGGGYPTRPIPIVLPNDLGGEPGDRVNLWYYDESPDADPNSNQWKIYGQGTISQDGKTIIPDPGVGQPKFCCGGGFASLIDRIARFLGPAEANAAEDAGGPEDGDPVDLASGIFIIRKTDMVLPGLIPIRITRTYRANLDAVGVFGVGGSFNYDLYLRPSGSQALSYQLPNGNRFTFSQQPDGSYINSNFPFLRGVVVTQLADGRAQMRLRDGTVRTFNSAGLLIEIKDRNNNRVVISRSSTTNVATKIIDASGRELTIGYAQSAGFLVISSITDPIGRTVRYNYDDNGRLITVTDPAGGVTTYTYDADNRVASITDARGILFLTNEYDSNGRVIKQTQADGSVYAFRYTLAGTSVTQTDVTDPNGNTTVYRFNGRQYLVRIVNAQGQMTRYERDFASNQIMAIYDQLNRKTSFTYDLNGNRTSMIDPAGNPMLMEYELVFNHLIRRIDPLNQITNLTYDVNGNLISITDPSGNRIVIDYNDRGLPITLTDVLANTTRFEYDNHGNLVTVTDPLGNKERKTFDIASRLIDNTDANGKTTRYTYDPLDRIIKVNNAILGENQFTYDSNGNLLSTTDAKEQITTNTYNIMDRLETRTDPLERTETYTYDLNGNLKTFTDRKGQVTTYSYDNLNRRIDTSFSDGANVSFIYDLAGRLTRLSDSTSGEMEFNYDFLLDRLMQEMTALGTIEYDYDVLGRRTRMSVNGQVPIMYSYDAASRLTQVAKGEYIINLGYDARSRRTSLIYPNGVETSYIYDAASRITNIVHRGSDALIEALNYTYDAAGNRISTTRTIGASTLLPETAQFSYDVANEQIQFNSDIPNLTFDANGNLVSQTDPYGTTTYTWDSRNRLVSISGPNVSVNFVYDGFGRRISKTINGIKTEYQYDGGDIVLEVDNGFGATSYVRALKVDEPFVRLSDTPEFYHSDALGSTQALTDNNGAVIASYSYEPFGETSDARISSNPFQYTGRENDATGLYYYRARYYSPSLHRFLTEDPIIRIRCLQQTYPDLSVRLRQRGGTFGVMNAYVYVDNNPIRFRDPSGLFKDDPRCINGCISKCGAEGGDCAIKLVYFSLCELVCVATAFIPGAGPGLATICSVYCVLDTIYDVYQCVNKERNCMSDCIKNCR